MGLSHANFQPQSWTELNLEDRTSIEPNSGLLVVGKTEDFKFEAGNFTFKLESAEF